MWYQNCNSCVEFAEIQTLKYRVYTSLQYSEQRGYIKRSFE